MTTAIKTKRASITIASGAEKITCRYYGDKDPFGKAIWYTDDGKAYELKHARLANTYAFIRYSTYDKEQKGEQA